MYLKKLPNKTKRYSWNVKNWTKYVQNFKQSKQIFVYFTVSHRFETLDLLFFGFRPRKGQWKLLKLYFQSIFSKELFVWMLSDVKMDNKDIFFFSISEPRLSLPTIYIKIDKICHQADKFASLPPYLFLLSPSHNYKSQISLLINYN